MLHTSNPIIKHKAGLLNLAEELGNISRACKVMGVHEILFIVIKNSLKPVALMRSLTRAEEPPILKTGLMLK